MDRYFGYNNLVLTDYLEFRFYRSGIRYGEPIRVATFNKEDRSISPLPESFSLLSKTLVDFTLSYKEPIKSGIHLARIMGGKAQRIRDNVREMLSMDSNKYADLIKMRDVVKEHLVTGLDDDMFADMYAQTLVYGLFAARYNDVSPDNFTRAEARELVPKTNPFLRSFFDHIAGTSFPDRLRFIVDELCEVFMHADVEKILNDFYGKEKGNKDPIIHFYEDFLKEYDKKKKMEMGVFYTPRPVVQFIVRAIDSVLKTEFGLEKGLADTTKVSLERKEMGPKGKEIKIQKEYHKVQILDVATGTGTFLNEIIYYIHSMFSGQEGRWPSYVENDILPRLHGFELMMASYTIAHLKLGMTLHNTGAQTIDSRIGIYLTNTLEAPVDYGAQNTLFGIMDSIAQESKSASKIKSEFPIMCVIGNPPYSALSMNKEYTENNAYKVEPGGLQKLKERKHWLDDDYVKFIRFAEELIEKNGEGIIGMITAHGYIDNPTFRGMRWHLRNTFDKIYVVDLHGNSRKKEVSLDGSKDENVFDIMSGVAIIIGVKHLSKSKEKLADVFISDLYGIRNSKFKELDNSNIEDINWTELPVSNEIWKVEGSNKLEYEKGFSIDSIFGVSSTGICSQRDSVAVQYTKQAMIEVIDDFNTLAEKELRDKYNLEKDGRDWTLKTAKQDVVNTGANTDLIKKVEYRPFDTRFTYFTSKSKGFIAYPRGDVMKHIANMNNIVLSVGRQGQVVGSMQWNVVFITHTLVDLNCFYRGGEQVFPLYLYSEDGSKVPNLNKGIWETVNKVSGNTTPENIMDYIYACLYSQRYREAYKEFLKVDFPKIPYPQNKDEFWKLVSLGSRLRALHFMEVVPESFTTYSELGTDIVETVKYEDGRVHINNQQYFGNVPEIAWDFYVGGYQPARKWLKDRKNRKLSSDDIGHYQKIIAILTETENLMKQIDDPF